MRSILIYNQVGNSEGHNALVTIAGMWVWFVTPLGGISFPDIRYTLQPFINWTSSKLVSSGSLSPSTVYAILIPQTNYGYPYVAQRPWHGVARLGRVGLV